MDESPPGPVTKEDVVEAMAESIAAEFEQADETEAERWRRKWLEETEINDQLSDERLKMVNSLTELRLAVRDIERNLVKAVSGPIELGAGRCVFDCLEIIKRAQKW